MFKLTFLFMLESFPTQNEHPLRLTIQGTASLTNQNNCGLCGHFHAQEDSQLIFEQAPIHT